MTSRRETRRGAGPARGRRRWRRLGVLLVGSVALVCFGSASAAVQEAATLLQEQGIECRTIALRLLAPMQIEAMQSALSGCSAAFVVEQKGKAYLSAEERKELEKAFVAREQAK